MSQNMNDLFEINHSVNENEIEKKEILVEVDS